MDGYEDGGLTVVPLGIAVERKQDHNQMETPPMSRVADFSSPTFHDQFVTKGISTHTNLNTIMGLNSSQQEYLTKYLAQIG